MTFLEAAIEVLKREGKPLHFKDLTRLAIKHDLLSVVGREPEAMMQTRLQAEVRRPTSELVRISPGVFNLRNPPSPSASRPRGASAESRRDADSAGAGETDASPSSAEAGANRDRGNRAGEGAAAAEGAGRGRRRRDRGGKGPSGGKDVSKDTKDVKDTRDRRETRPPAPTLPAVKEPAEASRVDSGSPATAASTPSTSPAPTATAAADVPASAASLAFEPPAAAPEPANAPPVDLRSASAAAPPAAAGNDRDPRRNNRRRRGGGGGRGPAPSSETSSPMPTPSTPPSVEPPAAAPSEPAPAQPKDSGPSTRTIEAAPPPLPSAQTPTSAPPSPVLAPAASEATPPSADSARSAPPVNLTAPNPVLMPQGAISRTPGEAPPPAPRLMALADAAYDVLRGSSDGRSIHYRQIAEIALKRRIVRGDLADLSRALRSALVREQRQRDSDGMRPRLRNMGQGQFALGERKLEPDLYNAERDLLDRLSRTREATRVALRRRLRSMPPGPFEIFMRLLLEKQGMVGAELIKRGEGVAYYAGTCSRGSRTLKVLCAIRPGEAEISREAIGELRAGVRLRGYDEGLLLCATRLSSAAYTEVSAAPGIEVYDQDALTDLLIRHQLGVRRMQIPLDYLDTELFNELLDQN